jgi:hypothetical protein
MTRALKARINRIVRACERLESRIKQPSYRSMMADVERRVLRELGNIKKKATAKALANKPIDFELTKSGHRALQNHIASGGADDSDFDAE